MNTLPYDPPLDDEVTFDTSGTLELTDSICVNVGGPSGTVTGHVWVSKTQLAFRPVVGQPHPQRVTIERVDITHVEVVQPLWMGLLRNGPPQVEVTARFLGRVDRFAFVVEPPEALDAALATPPLSERASPRDVLTEALAAGVAVPARYTPTLAAISFPQGFWHVESPEDLTDVVTGAFQQLGVELGDAFLANLDLEVETVWGPEDYETGPGSESWGRREQITRICQAANQALSGDRRLYEFAEDLPDWEFDEPVWLFLTEAERERLLELDVLHTRRD